MELFISENGAYKPAPESAIIDAGIEAARNAFNNGPEILSPADAKRYLIPLLAPLAHEVFYVMHMDVRGKLIELEQLARGDLTSAPVSVREVVKSALLHNTFAVILVHNHPSGVADASDADEQLTRRIRDALKLVEISVIDHLIVARDEVYSLELQEKI